jgi:hypothetical protein
MQFKENIFPFHKLQEPVSGGFTSDPPEGLLLEIVVAAIGVAAPDVVCAEVICGTAAKANGRRIPIKLIMPLRIEFLINFFILLF